MEVSGEEIDMVEEPYGTAHLSEDDLAAYLDRRLDGDEKKRAEAHLAWCSECRLLLTNASATLHRKGASRRRWVALGPAVAAAAAIVLFVMLPSRLSDRGDSPAHRDVLGAADALPTPIEPRGSVAAVEALVWHRLDRADRYRGTLFDSSGSVLWRSETVDTVALLPDSVRLSTGSTYLWRVEARIGVDRWVESELLRFTIEPTAGGP